MEEFNRTSFHPVALALTLAMGVALFFGRRDRAMTPLLLVAVLVPHAHRVVIGGLDFSMLRILLIFGWMRVVARAEGRGFHWHRLDIWLLVWLGFSTLAYIVGPRASAENVVNRLGMILDVAGSYFLLRVLLRNIASLDRSIRAFGAMAVFLSLPMLLENQTGRNVFSLLGGVEPYTIIRDGRLRCQGAFAHPIMAGNFGASVTPLFLALFLALPTQRARHGVSLIAATAIVIFSASSGPLIAYIAALVGWALWPVRRYMTLVRWGALVTLIVLHFIREKPVWHLIGRLSSLTGGTGYHRYALIDAAIRYFPEWWLLGTASTTHWKGFESRDITNQYVLEGVRGGCATMLAFVGMLVVGFQSVGQSLRLAAAQPAVHAGSRRKNALVAWGLGVALASHATAFIAVSYFGQLQTIFFLQLALIPSLQVALGSAPLRARVRTNVGTPAPAPASTRG